MKDGPYAWWDKRAVRHIRKNCDPCRNEVAVYLALCELASNNASNDFTATLHAIGKLCDVHHRGTLVTKASQ